MNRYIIALLFLNIVINYSKAQTPTGSIYFNLLDNGDTIILNTKIDSAKMDICVPKDKLFDHNGIFKILSYRKVFDNNVFISYPEMRKDSIEIIKTLYETDTIFVASHNLNGHCCVFKVYRNTFILWFILILQNI